MKVARCEKAQIPPTIQKKFSYEEIKQAEGVYQAEGYESYFISLGRGILFRYEASADNLASDADEWRRDSFRRVHATVCFEILASA